MEAAPGLVLGENPDRAPLAEELALLAVRLVALPFLLVGIVLWALVVPIAAACRSLVILLHGPRRGGGYWRALAAPVGPRDA